MMLEETKTVPVSCRRNKTKHALNKIWGLQTLEKDFVKGWWPVQEIGGLVYSNEQLGSAIFTVVAEDGGKRSKVLDKNPIRVIGTKTFVRENRMTSHHWQNLKVMQNIFFKEGIVRYKNCITKISTDNTP